jgi:hypothetical protein
MSIIIIIIIIIHAYKILSVPVVTVIRFPSKFYLVLKIKYL